LPDINPILPARRETPSQTRTEQQTVRVDSQGSALVKTNFDAQPMKAAVNETMAKESKEFSPTQQSNLHNAPETTKQQVMSPPQMDVKQAEMKDGFNPASTVLRGKDKDGAPKGDDSARMKEQDAIGEDSTTAALQAKNSLEQDSTISRPLMDKVKQEIAETIGALSGLPQARGRLLVLGPDNNEMMEIAALLELAGYQASVLTAVGVGSHYITTHPPDMLLLDLAMEGYEEMFATIAQNPAAENLPVLAMSSEGYPLSEEDAPNFGFAGVVSKNLPPHDFPKVVTELFLQLCPDKAVDGEGMSAAARAVPLTYSETVNMERTLDNILGKGGQQGRQLRSFLLQMADMTKEAEQMSNQLKQLEVLTGNAPTPLGTAASVQEIHQFLTDAGETVTPLERTSFVQMGRDAVEQRVQDTKEKAARQAMQLSARLLQLPHLVKDFLHNFGSVHTAGPAPGQKDAEAFQKVLDGVIGDAREQAHSLGTIIGRMEAAPRPIAATVAEEESAGASSAFDILPGLAALLGGQQSNAQT